MEISIDITKGMGDFINIFSTRKARLEFYKVLRLIYEDFKRNKLVGSIDRLWDIFYLIDEDSHENIYYFYNRLSVFNGNEEKLLSFLKYLVEEESGTKFIPWENIDGYEFQFLGVDLILGTLMFYSHYRNRYINIDNINNFDIELLLRILSYILFVENKPK